MSEKWAQHKWEIQTGLRFSGSFHTAYKPVGNWKINATASIPQRAPHVNELLSNGIHHGTATYEEGDINLQPEKALNLSLGFQWHSTNSAVSAEIDLYQNCINDFIYRQPVPEEPVLTIAGAFPKIVYRQTDAILTGLDASLIIKPHRQIEWTSRASLLRARNRQIDDWLAQMPADRVSTELAYNFKDIGRITGSYISLEYQHLFKQTRIPDEANGKKNYKMPPEAWSLLNLNASATIGVTPGLPVTFSVGVRNVTNKVYRDYLNSMRYFADEMGRNIYLRLKVPLSSRQMNSNQ